MLSVSLGFESLTARMLFGAVMILAGVLIAEVRPAFWRKSGHINDTSGNS